MLKGINTLMTPELLDVLSRMGHGDTIAVVDSNYPAYSAGVPVIAMPSLNCPEAVRIVVELMPLDTFIDAPVRYMEGAGDTEVREVTRDVLAVASELERREVQGEAVERFAFHEEARSARAIIHTQETRPDGCYLLTKGVLPAFGPDGRPL